MKRRASSLDQLELQCLLALCDAGNVLYLCCQYQLHTSCTGRHTSRQQCYTDFFSQSLIGLVLSIINVSSLFSSKPTGKGEKETQTGLVSYFMMFIMRDLRCPHYRAFISSLLHTSREGRESREGERSSGKLSRLCIPEGKETHILHSTASNTCATQVGRYTHRRRGRQGAQGRACFCGCSQKKLGPSRCKQGPRQHCILAGAWPVGHGSCEALLGLPNMSRGPRLCEWC